MRAELWRQLEELFHAAIEQRPERRQAFVINACGPDVELRRELELLLSQDEHAGCLLDPPVLVDSTDTPGARGSMVGRYFGPYQVVSLLGAGGMGEVYRAHDIRLGRDVAIKMLPPEFARDAHRLARLRREARTLASLNHPNIAAIYGLEELSDLDCLVLELVEGETLKGPLVVEQALDYSCQVAQALEAAHGKGIIHRDLKPANIKVTPEGRVKVLDFGLAKAVWRQERKQDLLRESAINVLNSHEGNVVGTSGYMSPEQVQGNPVDSRTDIWAFGCILYELLTGKSAFPGETPAERVAAELGLEPDWNALPRKTPAKVRELLKRCLQKESLQRPATIGDVRRTIQAAQRKWNRWQVIVVAGALLISVAIVAVVWQNANTHPPDRSQWVQLTKFPDPVSQPALSPDGRMLTFIRSPRTDFAVGQVYLKKLPDGEPIQLTHDNLKKTGPAFSPDGLRIAYSVVDGRFQWETWMIPVQGGQPRRWLSNAGFLTWADEGLVLFSEIRVRPLMGIVAAQEDRTGVRHVYMPSNDRGMAERPALSPDRKWILVPEIGAYGNWEQCRVVPMDGSSAGRLVGPPGAGCTFAAWSRDGNWIYLTSKSGGLYHIWRQRFPDGQPEQFTSGPTEEEGVAMAPDGRSFVTAVAIESSSLWIHDRRGERQISVLEGNAAYPKFAPDGKRLCYRIVKAVPRFGTTRDPGELWVADLESGLSERVAPGFQPLDYDISRDGRRVVMEAPDGEGKPRLWLAPLDHRAPPTQVPNVEGRKALFGPTGEIFFRRAEGSSSFLYRVRPDGTGLRKALEQAVLSPSRIPPGGNWIEIWAPLPGNQPAAVQVVRISGGPPVVIGSNTLLEWSSTGDSIWITAGPVRDGRTYAVPLPRGKVLPRIPKHGFRTEDEVASLPGAHKIDAAAAPGPTIDVYAFLRQTTQRNLYRIPIP